MNKTEKQVLKDKYKIKINNPLHTHGNFKVIDTNNDVRTLRGLVTTSSVDSENEVVLPDGLDWTYFIKTGGWVYWRHAETIDDINVLPIGCAKEIKRIGEGWEATTNLLKKPEGWVNWLPDAVYSMVTDPASNQKIGASIGFIPTEGRPATPKDMSMFGNEVEWVWTKAKVLEFSYCPDPSNADSMNTVIKSASSSKEYRDYVKEQLKLKDLRQTETDIEKEIKEEVKEEIPTDYSKIMQMLTDMQNQIATVNIKIEELASVSATETVKEEEIAGTEVVETEVVETEVIEEVEETEEAEVEEPMEEFVYIVNTIDNSILQNRLGKAIIV